MPYTVYYIGLPVLISLGIVPAILFPCALLNTIAFFAALGSIFYLGYLPCMITRNVEERNDKRKDNPGSLPRRYRQHIDMQKQYSKQLDLSSYPHITSLVYNLSDAIDKYILLTGKLPLSFKINRVKLFIYTSITEVSGRGYKRNYVITKGSKDTLLVLSKLTYLQHNGAKVCTAGVTVSYLDIDNVFTLPLCTGRLDVEIEQLEAVKDRKEQVVQDRKRVVLERQEAYNDQLAAIDSVLEG